VSSSLDEAALDLATRMEVLDRDNHLCRLCGAHSEVLHVHHIVYRSGGGRDTFANLISLDWKCHDRVHSNKPLWQPVLLALPSSPGITGLQLLRWARKRALR
jgi:5-methylcytosine-specific restriction endonuclease McrA